METKQKEAVSKGDSCASIQRISRRTTNWEISDSENEEEPHNVQTEENKSLSIKLETVERETDYDQGLNSSIKATVSSAGGHASVLAIPLPVSTTPSPSKGSRKKKSLEELETEREHADKRRRERELKKQEKERKKDLQKSERELQRKEKEKKKDLEKTEMQKRKEHASAMKLLRPDQCVKYVTIQVDTRILEDAGSEDLCEAFQSSGYNYSIEPHAVPRSFTWRREMPLGWTCVEGVELQQGEEDELILLVEPNDFLRNIRSFAQVPRSSRIGQQSRETIESVFGISAQLSEKKVTVVVLGFHDYRLCQKLSHHMESLGQAEEYGSERSRSDNYVSRHQIAEALVYVQLFFNTEVLFLDTWKELGQHVCAVTKSLAQRPYRNHCEAQTFSFCTSVGSWRGWGPKGSISGLPLTWRRQIQQLNRVSPAMAAAVAQAYPSPQLLLQAYAACNTERERMLLLADLQIPRECDPGTGEDSEEHCRDDDRDKKRRIGPDLSRRVWLCMTSTNPELVLDLSSS
ncbi:probable crossover junction endonuclease EME2 [Bombina bombina]|uniref:probable crossover junction endonuclease EME2 n=1 Tax=Bombina bombina TaxID=8345 RepID=UPI00235ACA71|nr:probable crossover junction endonuclease EME2 [Bombina bombina]